MMSYPSDRLHEEVAALCLHMHWPLDQVLSLDHHQRQRWLEEITAFQRRQQESQGRP